MEPTLVPCPYCNGMHEPELVELCPLKPSVWKFTLFDGKLFITSEDVQIRLDEAAVADLLVYLTHM